MFMPGLGASALGARVHQDFATAVHSLGHDFRILTTEARTTTVGNDAIGQVLPLSSAWRRADAVAAPWLRTRMLLSSAAALARHLRANGSALDLLHVEVAYPFGAAAALGRIASGWTGPIAITPMGEDTLVIAEQHYGFRRHLFPRRLVEMALRRAVAIRCISPLHERVLATLAPATPRRVIPLNVSSAVVLASEESADARLTRRRDARQAVDAQLGTEGRPVVLSLGRLHPFKGVDVLIGALRRVPDAVLVIAGPSLSSRAAGDEATRLASLVEQLRLGDRVRFLGPVTPERSMQLMAAADVVAVPSRLESLNKVCVEAVAVGTTFVVTETTGISAWARESGIGFVVPASDEQALAEELVTALTSRPLDSDRIRTFVQQFSPSTVAAAVVAFYRDVTGLV
jgi:glycosyltransferase involved in cell wall biosynthesis